MSVDHTAWFGYGIEVSPVEEGEDISSSVYKDCSVVDCGNSYTGEHTYYLVFTRSYVQLDLGGSSAAECLRGDLSSICPLMDIALAEAARKLELKDVGEPGFFLGGRVW